MKENYDDNELFRNTIQSNKIKNAPINDINTKHLEEQSPNKLHKTMRQMKKATKLRRYKIGLFFLIIYLGFHILEWVISLTTKFDYFFDPFGEIYLRFSSFSILIFFSPFLTKSNTSKFFDLINITKYYIPDWKKKKNRNLSSIFYVFEGTEEKFNKTIHKISFLFMVLIYLSEGFCLISFLKASNYEKSIYIIPILFPMGSVLIILFLRKYFLHTQISDLLSKIALGFLLIGVIFLFYFQYSIFDNSKVFEIFGYSFLGGIFFGMFSTFLKYYSNIYGENFKLAAVLGYIGLYTLITVPFLICIICLWNDDLDTNFNMFTHGNNLLSYIIIFICSFGRFVCVVHCIISLSPLVFSVAIFFILLINMVVNLIWGSITSHFTFYVAAVLLLIGVIGGVLDKYLKNSMKIDKIENEEIGRKTRNKINDNKDLYAQLAGTEIEN